MQRCNSFGKLLQTDGAKKVIQLWPKLVLLSGWISFIVEFLVEAWFMQDLSETSFMYKGHQSQKNLNTPARRHCLNQQEANLSFWTLSFQHGLHYLVEDRKVHICFEEFATYFWIFCSGWGTKLSMHNRIKAA